MADEVAAELERRYPRSRWQADEDLVLAHPATGEPLYRAGILRRMREALSAAGHHLERISGDFSAPNRGRAEVT